MPHSSQQRAWHARQARHAGLAARSHTHRLPRPAPSCPVPQKLVETAMLAAVSGLAYVVSTILKLDNTLGYFLPLPIVIAALRSGPAAGWSTMSATGFLLVGRCAAAGARDCVTACARA